MSSQNSKGGIMKRLLIAAMLLTSLTTMGATTGTLLLQGTVAKKVEITVAPKSIATTLDLETTQTDLSVASVTGKSNSNTGYKITVTSTNLGKLKNPVASPTLLAEVSYTMKLDSAAIALTTAAGTSIDYTGKGPFPIKDVKISYTGVNADLYEPGTYTDSVLFTIAAN